MKLRLWIRSRWLTELRSHLTRKRAKYRPSNRTLRGTIQLTREVTLMSGAPFWNIERRSSNDKSKRSISQRIWVKKSITESLRMQWPRKKLVSSSRDRLRTRNATLWRWISCSEQQKTLRLGTNTTNKSLNSAILLAVKSNKKTTNNVLPSSNRWTRRLKC